MLQSSDLPDTLRERVRVLTEGPIDGAFVLYWVRGAIRAHENPALDTAVAAANRLGLPVFVHQALSERYPWASDRHHTFILEGARDLARDLARRGIGHTLHLERPGQDGPVTRTLAERAALVIAEDLPTHPMSDWVEGLARNVSTPVWLVDAACVVPMTLVDRPYTRAFAFRRAIEDALQARVRLPWVDIEPDAPAFIPDDLPYEPVDLESDLAPLVASCRIDHSVGPVSHTRGGSVAGYARWQAFVRDGGLGRYARTRNNPADDGVSRMSAYLHHGMVAPTRLAREAAEHGGKGADKYVDEVVIWRELAWNYCRHEPRHDTLRALPAWARQTLQAHAADPRPALYDAETLARARTGEPLWDACQRSLLKHGELHNNVRMTWGKALLEWTPDPESALRTLIDLNHRYALDGRDPASFGGLLWCMGGFDRPFEPARPILGTVRSRDIEAHAERMDLPAYERRVDRPLHGSSPRIAVVGAGPAGALCARVLTDHGLDVVVYDKGRGAGGRLSTRRADAQRYDHGAVFIAQPHPALRTLVEAWQQRGLLQSWTAPFIRVRDHSASPMAAGPRLVPTPSMSALVKHLVSDLDVRFGQRVVALDRVPDGVMLHTEQGLQERFDHVLVAAPAPQAAELLRAGAPQLATALDGVAYEARWVVMAGIPTGTGRRWGLARVDGDPVLDLLVRNQTKPGRPPGEQWVVHATAAYTQAHLDEPREDVAQAVWSAVRDRLDLPEATHLAAHRWLFSQVIRPVGADFLLCDDASLGVCGDGVIGGGITEAMASGAALAGRLLGHLHHHAPPPATRESPQLSLLSPEVP